MSNYLVMRYKIKGEKKRKERNDLEPVFIHCLTHRASDTITVLSFDQQNNILRLAKPSDTLSLIETHDTVTLSTCREASTIKHLMKV